MSVYPVPHRHTGFRGYGYFVTRSFKLRAKNFAQNFFRIAMCFPIIVCRVKMYDSAVKGRFENILDSIHITILDKAFPESQRNSWKIQPTFAAFFYFHISVLLRQPGHDILGQLRYGFESADR